MKFALIVTVIFAGITSLFSSEDTTRSTIKSYRIESPFQRNSTIVRILLPDNIDTEKSYKVLYVLPVNADDERKRCKPYEIKLIVLMRVQPALTTGA